MSKYATIIEKLAAATCLTTPAIIFGAAWHQRVSGLILSKSAKTATRSFLRIEGKRHENHNRNHHSRFAGFNGYFFGGHLAAANISAPIRGHATKVMPAKTRTMLDVLIGR